jgi:IS605 OrfB family transposase
MTTKNDKKKILKTFTVHETDMKVVRHLKKAILSYKHLENMLNILLKTELDKIYEIEIIEDRDYSMFNLLLNPTIMKAVLSNTNGAEKTKDNISLVNDYFKDNQLFKSAKEMGHILNDKNISMIVRRLSKDWNNIFDKRKEFFANPSAFTGVPQFPSAKKIAKVHQYSIPMEQDKFSLKRKNVLGLTVFKRMIYTRFRTNDYVSSKTIKSMTVSLSNGNIYYNFNYEVPKQDKVKTSSKVQKVQKIAGGDVGVINNLSIFIDDKKTQSLIVSGSPFIKYNSYFNKQLAKLNIELSKNVIEYKTIVKKDKTTVEIPVAYNSIGRSLKKQRSQLHENRNRYFDSEMNKISKKVLTYLQVNKVSDLVISTNLSQAKEDGSIEMRKKTKQKFYQIPFGKMLNLLKTKGSEFGICVVDKDEAYTSKTSCLTRDVNDNQARKALKIAVTPNDLNGNRGAKGNKLGRGMYKDRELNKVFNSDLNGAANHIKVGFPETDLSVYKTNLWKVCNPIKVKSTNDFDLLINQIVKVNSRGDLTNCRTFEQDDQIFSSL